MNTFVNEALPKLARNLIHLLESQSNDALTKGWTKLDWEITKSSSSDGFNILLQSQQIGFNFNEDGEFQGIFNWQ